MRTQSTRSHHQSSSGIERIVSFLSACNKSLHSNGVIMDSPNKNKRQHNEVNVDPVTLVAVLSAALLISLLIMGFMFQ